ncbi:acyl-CoA thioesterase [Paenarthrobacter nicotinovorans]|uniref:Acyl-CoA thioesterase n=1 Tax=Paenarthrobacter nicotinovorans TaxID=29320 RepID=A0ABT9TSX9_PAENI|nr:hotdog fold thioesterase [Paenarthrobacter nicotinovorans]MDQ0104793.1 acyl-CoA thioesterase [Paenarthrobacter nicotinovorans]
MKQSTVIADPARAMLAADRALEGLGIRVLSASEGRATAVLTVTPQMANGHGIAHGGLVFALADTAFAMAANTFGAGIATAEASISYISPALISEELVACAEVTFHEGRRMIVDVKVRAGERTVAIYRGTGRALRPTD